MLTHLALVCGPCLPWAFACTSSCCVYCCWCHCRVECQPLIEPAVRRYVYFLTEFVTGHSLRDTIFLYVY